eukprot:g29734.t1
MKALRHQVGIDPAAERCLAFYAWPDAVEMLQRAAQHLTELGYSMEELRENVDALGSLGSIGRARSLRPMTRHKGGTRAAHARHVAVGAVPAVPAVPRGVEEAQTIAMAWGGEDLVPELLPPGSPEAKHDKEAAEGQMNSCETVLNLANTMTLWRRYTQ